ncbi:MAG TPA: CBS domain-containing protein [Usitatibacter sp.]|nr:CBS domain-containing protein [Usitatibacter sp.]
MKVERVYTREVVATSRSATLAEAARTMRKFHVGTLVVVDGASGRQEVAGIVTDRDLVVQGLAEGLDPRRATVEKVMAPVVASVSEDAELHEALERMRAAGVRRLLVTKPTGEPAGIVSLDDAVDGLVAELASLAGLMKNELRREAGARVGETIAA